MKRFFQYFILLGLGIALANSAGASDGVRLSKGQTVYVPVYSNVISGSREVPSHLSNTLVIRNTDLHNPIEVIAADYYDTRGRLIKSYYAQPVAMAPLETVYLYLSEQDREGGVGANFIITWRAAREVNAPIIECVMAGSRGRAFVSPSRVIDKNTR
jgi:hypothetical protein